jgi:hypothetical protein
MSKRLCSADCLVCAIAKAPQTRQSAVQGHVELMTQVW